MRNAKKETEWVRTSNASLTLGRTIADAESKDHLHTIPPPHRRPRRLLAQSTLPCHGRSRRRITAHGKITHHADIAQTLCIPCPASTIRTASSTMTMAASIIALLLLALLLIRVLLIPRRLLIRQQLQRTTDIRFPRSTNLRHSTSAPRARPGQQFESRRQRARQ